MVDQYSEQIFSNLYPVYDGRKNLITAKQLPIGNQQIELKILLTGDGCHEREFTVNIKYIRPLSLGKLKDVLEGRGSKLPMDTVLACDTILRHMPSLVYTPVGKSFFSAPQGNTPLLGGGREVWFGFHQSIKPTQWKLMLNIDVSATAFYTGLPVIDFLMSVLDLNISRTELADLKMLSDAQRMKFTREIRGLKIEITHCGLIKRKYRVFGVTRRSASQLTFPLQMPDTDTAVECTVEKYFFERHGRILDYPYLPCLQVGQENKHTYLPLEVCNVIPGQRCIKKLTDTQTSTMIKATARSAPGRGQEIANLVHRASFHEDPYVTDFGMSVENRMTQLSARVLPSPKILFSNGQNYATPNHGAWDMRQKKFYVGVEIKTWAIACFANARMCSDQALRNFTKHFQKISEDAGMMISNGPVFCKYVENHQVDQVEPMFRYLTENFHGLQLILVILPGKSPVYAEIKRVGDTILGVSTQCVQFRNIIKTTPQTMSNLCLKINAKLGGINNILMPQMRPKIFKEPVIFFGADLEF